MNYDDIIDLPHPVSEKYPRLSREQRAAQFSPFAALAGHAEAIARTAKFAELKSHRKIERNFEDDAGFWEDEVWGDFSDEM